MHLDIPQISFPIPLHEKTLKSHYHFLFFQWLQQYCETSVHLLTTIRLPTETCSCSSSRSTTTCWSATTHTSTKFSLKLFYHLLHFWIVLVFLNVGRIGTHILEGCHYLRILHCS